MKKRTLSGLSTILIAPCSFAASRVATAVTTIPITVFVAFTVAVNLAGAAAAREALWAQHVKSFLVDMPPGFVTFVTKKPVVRQDSAGRFPANFPKTYTVLMGYWEKLTTAATATLFYRDFVFWLPLSAGIVPLQKSRLAARIPSSRRHITQES